MKISLCKELFVWQSLKIKPKVHQTLEQIDKVSSCLVLQPILEEVRNVFHILQLKQYVRGETHIMNYS